MAQINPGLSNALTYGELEAQWFDGNDFVPAATSGSTGTPKLMRLSKALMRASAEATNSFFGITSSSRLHSCVGARYIGGKMMMVRALIAGAGFSYEQPSNRPLSRCSTDIPIDLLAVVPSQLLWLTDNADTLPVIKNIIAGGSALSPQLRRAVLRSGLNVYETYGMTETASHIALKHVDSEPDSPFVPLPGIRTDIDSRGCLTISRPPFDTVLTNDLATVGPGGCFNIMGRFDDVIISGGVKVHPAEVERKASALVGCPVAVSWSADSKWGQRVVWVLQTDRFDNSMWPSLYADIRQTFKSAECPAALFVTPCLPLTGMGKLDRAALHNLCLQGCSVWQKS